MKRLRRETRLTLPLLSDDATPRALKIERSHIVALHNTHNDLLESPNLRGALLDLLLKI